MISELTEQDISTYNSPTIPNQSVMALYAGSNRSVASPSSTAIILNLDDETFNRRFDYVVTSGTYLPPQLWNFPIAGETEAIIKPRKLSLKQAQDLAHKALVSAEARRQREREAEAKFWADLD